MNKLLYWGIPAALLYAGYRAWNIKESLKYFEYTPAGVSFGFEGITPVLKVKLNVYNPNKTAVPVNDILGQIFYKGQAVASFKNTAALKINGGETHQVEMKIRVRWLSTLQAIITQQKDKTIEVSGLLKTGFFDLPFGFGYDFGKKLITKQAPAVKGFAKWQTVAPGSVTITSTNIGLLKKLRMKFLSRKTRKQRNIQNKFVDSFGLRKNKEAATAGIGKTSVRMEFESNDAMKSYFRNECKTPKFSLNG